MTTCYDQRAVLFLDILGFSSLVEAGKIDLLLETLKGLQAEAKAVERVGKLNVTVFSDCIVVSERIGDGKGAVRVVDYARILALDLLAKGFLTRGAIVAGELHHEDGIVLGKALINAYRLESKKALYPRILVDHHILQIATETLSIERPGIPNIGNEYFREDFDGQYHLDIFHRLYFTPQAYWGKKVDLGPTQFRDSCLEFIGHIFSIQAPAGTEEKYAWLANYFFEICERNRWSLPNNLPVHDRKRTRHEQDLHDESALDALD
jgi:hypothetical protein